MNKISNLLRNCPADILKSYFEGIGTNLADEIDWSLPDGEVVKPLLQSIDALAEVDRQRVLADAERVVEMADEPGQTALLAVSNHAKRLEGLPSGQARALWVLLNEPNSFARAEDVRFTDDRRRGKMWSGFIGEADKIVAGDEQSLERFKVSLKQHFNSQNVHVEVFQRSRPTLNDGTVDLVQVTIYREGLPENVKVFVGGRLDHTSQRPVLEAALTYEPKTGATEVVARDRESREELARLFAKELLGSTFEDEQFPLRQYRLDVLMEPHGFPTDPEDGIEAVRLVSLRLMPVDSQLERTTLECLRPATSTIWEMAESRFGENTPLSDGWIATQARISVIFYPDQGHRRSRTLPVTITMPHGCDLKDRTERERLVGEKYLRRWGLLADV